jgi:hypothetical protein
MSQWTPARTRDRQTVTAGCHSRCFLVGVLVEDDAGRTPSVSTTKHLTNKTYIRIVIATVILVGLIIPWIAFLIWLAIVVIFG